MSCKTALSSPTRIKWRNEGYGTWSMRSGPFTGEILATSQTPKGVNIVRARVLVPNGTVFSVANIIGTQAAKYWVENTIAGFEARGVPNDPKPETKAPPLNQRVTFEVAAYLTYGPPDEINAYLHRRMTAEGRRKKLTGLNADHKFQVNIHGIKSIVWKCSGVEVPE